MVDNEIKVGCWQKVARGCSHAIIASNDEGAREAHALDVDYTKRLGYSHIFYVDNIIDGFLHEDISG